MRLRRASSFCDAAMASLGVALVVSVVVVDMHNEDPPPLTILEMEDAVAIGLTPKTLDV